MLGSLRASDAPRALTESREGGATTLSTTLSLFRSLADLRVRHATFRPAPKRSPCQGWAGRRPARESLSSQSLSLRVGRAASRPVLRVCEPSNRNPSCQTGLNSGWDFMPARHTGPPGFETQKRSRIPIRQAQIGRREAGSARRCRAFRGEGIVKFWHRPLPGARIPVHTRRADGVDAARVRRGGTRARARRARASFLGRFERRPPRARAPQNPDAADASRAPVPSPRSSRAPRAPRSAPAGGWTPRASRHPCPRLLHPRGPHGALRRRARVHPRDTDIHDRVMLDALRAHPDARAKIGAGAACLQVRQHASKRYDSFVVVRADGTFDDFSYRKCVEALFPGFAKRPKTSTSTRDDRLRRLARRFQTLDVRLHRQSRRRAQRAHLQTSLRRVSPRHRPRARGRARPHPRRRFVRR